MRRQHRLVALLLVGMSSAVQYPTFTAGLARCQCQWQSYCPDSCSHFSAAYVNGPSKSMLTPASLAPVALATGCVVPFCPGTTAGSWAAALPVCQAVLPVWQQGAAPFQLPDCKGLLLTWPTAHHQLLSPQVPIPKPVCDSARCAAQCQNGHPAHYLQRPQPLSCSAACSLQLWMAPCPPASASPTCLAAGASTAQHWCCLQLHEGGREPAIQVFSNKSAAVPTPWRQPHVGLQHLPAHFCRLWAPAAQGDLLSPSTLWCGGLRVKAPNRHGRLA